MGMAYRRAGSCGSARQFLRSNSADKVRRPSIEIIWALHGSLMATAQPCRPSTRICAFMLDSYALALGCPSTAELAQVAVWASLKSSIVRGGEGLGYKAKANTYRCANIAPQALPLPSLLLHSLPQSSAFRDPWSSYVRWPFLHCLYVRFCKAQVLPVTADLPPSSELWFPAALWSALLGPGVLSAPARGRLIRSLPCYVVSLWTEDGSWYSTYRPFSASAATYTPCRKIMIEIMRAAPCSTLALRAATAGTGGATRTHRTTSRLLG